MSVAFTKMFLESLIELVNNAEVAAPVLQPLSWTSDPLGISGIWEWDGGRAVSFHCRLVRRRVLALGRVPVWA